MEPDISRLASPARFFHLLPASATIVAARFEHGAEQLKVPLQIAFVLNWLGSIRDPVRVMWASGFEDRDRLSGMAAKILHPSAAFYGLLASSENPLDGLLADEDEGPVTFFAALSEAAVIKPDILVIDGVDDRLMCGAPHEGQHKDPGSALSDLSTATGMSAILLRTWHLNRKGKRIPGDFSFELDGASSIAHTVVELHHHAGMVAAICTRGDQQGEMIRYRLVDDWRLVQ